MAVKIKDKSENQVRVDLLALSKCKLITENNEAVEMYDLWKNQIAIFVFLRHFGCIFCRKHAQEVWSQREKYESGGAKIYFIGNGAPYMIKMFKDDLGIQDAPVFTDPTLVSFRASGFKRGFLAAVGPRVVVNAVKALSEGHVQGGMYNKDQGDLWQLGGILVVKPEGKVGYHFISSAAGDYSPENDLAGLKNT